MDLPLYFPTDVNRRLIEQNPRDKRFDVVFQDYGCCGHVDVERPALLSETNVQNENENQTAVYMAQRQHHRERDRSVLCASIPTLPLSDTPVKVHWPLRDNVIGDRPSLPSKVTKFSHSLVQVSSSFKDGVSWRKPFLTAKKTMDMFSYYKRLPDFKLKMIQSNLPPSVSHILDMYTELSQQPSFYAYNPDYSGGLLSCVQENCEDEIRHFLFHARGRNLNRLALTVTAPSDADLITSRVAAESRVEKVFQVHAAAVQDNVFVATRHANSCSLFSVLKSDCMNMPLANDKTDLCDLSVSTNSHSKLSCNSGVLPNTTVQFKPVAECRFRQRKGREVPMSVCVSPYVPGEGLFCSDTGTVKLWSASQSKIRTVERHPRFTCQDSWRHAYYACHPRQMVLADRTAVQMLDDRDGFRNSLDLFALPSPLVHRKECIVAAHHHVSDCPLHVVATSHSVFVVDQRFGGTPVMQWYPDLEAPLQYLTSTEYHTDNGERRGVILAGCQYPAEVMCYPFNHGNGQTVTSSLSPWRLSKMADISTEQQYKCFYSGVNPCLFQERMGLSLAGMAAAKGSRPKSFVSYQADCYGEIFFQQYSTPHNPYTAVKTGIPAPGKKDHCVSDEAQNHTSLWLEHLQKQVFSQKIAQRDQELKEQKRVPACFPWNGGKSSSAEERTECCSACEDTVDTPISGHGKTSELLCGSCHGIHSHFSTKDKQSMQSHSASPSLLRLSDTDFTDGRSDSGHVNETATLLENVVPSMDGGESDPFGAVHLGLRKPNQEMPELVRLREEEYSRLLGEYKAKNSRTQARKNRKKRASCADTQEDTDSSTQHSIFNSAEHQQQNSRINSVLRDIIADRSAKTLSDTNDRNMSANYGGDDSNGENTPPDEEIGDLSFDLFDSMELEEVVPQNLSQDDDDEFFSSIDHASLSFNFSQNVSSASPIPTSAHSQRQSKPNRNSLELENAFFASSQKESQSLSQNQLQLSSQQSDILSSRLSPIQFSDRVKTSTSQKKRSLSLKQSGRETNSRNSSFSSSHDLESDCHHSSSVTKKRKVKPGINCELSGLTDTLAGSQSQSAMFTPTASSVHTPQLLSLKTPDKDVHGMSHLNVSTSSERRKTKSIKKYRGLSRSGFC